MYRPASASPFFNTPSRKKRVVWADFRRKSAQRVLRETKVTTPGYIPAVAEERARMADALLAIVHAWSAWRALQQCRPHRRQPSSSPASLLRLLQSACSRRSLLCRRLSPPARTSRTMRMVACYSCQGHAAEEVSPLTRHTGSARKSNGLGATATAARLSRRAGRPKTRRAEDGVAILRALAEAVTVTGGSFASRNLKKNLVGPGARPRPQPALPRQGVGQWP